VVTVVWIIVLCLGILIVALIYPGELSHISSRLNRSLYNSAAQTYQRKWRSPAYGDAGIDSSVIDFAKSSCGRSNVFRVLDLGCGTGRGIRMVAESLPGQTVFTGVDSSPAMLDVFRNWLEQQEDSLADRVSLIDAELGDWSVDRQQTTEYGLVMMLEVGEFVPEFVSVVQRIAKLTADGGGLLLTRPAKLWYLFFPGRKQSRNALAELLVSCGFEAPRYMKWRLRYELVFCHKKPANS
jgi:SAM-dependent methyltransferase